MTLYYASSNPGKLREFPLIAADHGADWIRVEPVPGLHAIEAPVEDGGSFQANATIKAVYYSRFVEGLVFADDSGLEVEALNGAPGVDSAYYAGPQATNDENNALLLQNLKGFTNRQARFVCIIALARHGELLTTVTGTADGEIADELKGNGGFGYDPLFFYPPFGCTFGEVPAERKLRVSHRGTALRKLLDYLETHG